MGNWTLSLHLDLWFPSAIWLPSLWGRALYWGLFKQSGATWDVLPALGMTYRVDIILVVCPCVCPLAALNRHVKMCGDLQWVTHSARPRIIGAVKQGEIFGGNKGAPGTDWLLGFGQPPINGKQWSCPPLHALPCCPRISQQNHVIKHSVNGSWKTVNLITPYTLLYRVLSCC